MINLDEIRAKDELICTSSNASISELIDLIYKSFGESFINDYCKTLPEELVSNNLVVFNIRHDLFSFIEDILEYQELNYKACYEIEKNLMLNLKDKGYLFTHQLIKDSEGHPYYVLAVCKKKLTYLWNSFLFNLDEFYSITLGVRTGRLPLFEDKLYENSGIRCTSYYEEEKDLEDE